MTVGPVKTRSYWFVVINYRGFQTMIVRSPIYGETGGPLLFPSENAAWEHVKSVKWKEKAPLTEDISVIETQLSWISE